MCQPFYERFSFCQQLLIVYTFQVIYRVYQKFVPLISCTITFDHNYIFTWNCSKMYIRRYTRYILEDGHIFRISVTDMPLSFFLSHSVAVEAWIGIQRVDPQMIHFKLFYHLVGRIQFNPKQNLFSLGSWKKKYFGHSTKKDNNFGPLPQQGFCTSLQIWNELGVNWQTKKKLSSNRIPIILSIII